MSDSPNSEAPRARAQPESHGRTTVPHPAWLLILLLAAVEFGAHFVAQSRVVPESDWASAAEFVRSEWRGGDAVTVAPAWAGPLMRSAMNGQLDLKTAARTDLAPFTRLWSFSIRGHRSPEAPSEAPEIVRTFGRIRVERWSLPRVPVVYDFVDQIGTAHVSLIEQGVEQPCRYVPRGRATGGGLGSGPITPGERHVCDPQRPWLWVGRTVEEDLDMLPRLCVWQHPAGSDPVRARFDTVPLGRSVVLHAGLWWEHERTLDGGPVDVAIRLDGEEIGRLRHVDGNGWARMEAIIPPERRGMSGIVDIEVTSPAPHLRTLCWAATMQGDVNVGPREDAR